MIHKAEGSCFFCLSMHSETLCIVFDRFTTTYSVDRPFECCCNRGSQQKIAEFSLKANFKTESQLTPFTIEMLLVAKGLYYKELVKMPI